MPMGVPLFCEARPTASTCVLPHFSFCRFLLSCGVETGFPARPRGRYETFSEKVKGRHVMGGGFCRCAVWFVAVCTAMAMLIPTRTSFAADEPKTILILQSYGQNFRPWSEYSKALRQELERRSPWRLIIQEFSVITPGAEKEDAESLSTISEPRCAMPRPIVT